MTQRAKTLVEQARKLPPVERVELVDGILASLDEPDAELDRLWAREAEDRLAAYRRGEIKAVHLNEVLAKYRVS
jgi:putative addiction module component (TIGR02574 family)